jgi:cytochrome c-type biogenesis protein CcmE
MTTSRKGFKPKRQRLMLVAAAGVAIAGAAAIGLSAVGDTMQFFCSPTDIKNKSDCRSSDIRLGGLVEAGSVQKQSDGLTIKFVVTDTNSTIPVSYTGIVPDLFREGQGVVAEGRVGPDGKFVAQTLLARHDENYMPRDVANKLKEQGHWEGDYGTRPDRAVKQQVTEDLRAAERGSGT